MTLVKPSRQRPRLTHAVAELFPPQGQWSEDEYLMLSDRKNRLIELSDGKLEVLDMPTDPHQKVVGRLHYFIMHFLMSQGIGIVRVAPLPVRLWPGKFREPDIVYLSSAHADRITPDYWGVPDLVVEVHSPGSHTRDKRTKREEYAQTGIPEYWMVDTDAQTIEVYRLQGERYDLAVRLSVGDRLTSPLLPGLEIDVAAVFARE